MEITITFQELESLLIQAYEKGRLDEAEEKYQEEDRHGRDD